MNSDKQDPSSDPLAFLASLDSSTQRSQVAPPSSRRIPRSPRRTSARNIAIVTVGLSCVAVIVATAMYYAQKRSQKVDSVRSAFASSQSRFLTLIAEAEAKFTPDDNGEIGHKRLVIMNRERELFEKHRHEFDLPETVFTDDPKAKPFLDRINRDLAKEFGTDWQATYWPSLTGKVITVSQRTNDGALAFDPLFVDLKPDRSASGPNETAMILVLRYSTGEGPRFKSPASGMTIESSQEKCTVRAIDVASKRVAWEEDVWAPSPEQTHRVSPQFRLADHDILEFINHLPMLVTKGRPNKAVNPSGGSGGF